MSKRIVISLPPYLVEEVDLELYDPLRARVVYGARSRLIAELLRRWLRYQKDGTQENVDVELDELNVE